MGIHVGASRDSGIFRPEAQTADLGSGREALTPRRRPPLLRHVLQLDGFCGTMLNQDLRIYHRPSAQESPPVQGRGDEKMQ